MACGENQSGLLVMDHKGMVVDWSPGAEAIFGWSSDDALGVQLSRLIIPQRLRAAHEAGLRRFTTTGEGGTLIGKTLKIIATHRDGREFPVEITISMETAPEGPRFRTVLRRAEEPE